MLGVLAALVQLFSGPLVNPGAFGFARWLNAWVDVIALPALIPALVYIVLVLLRSLSPQADPADFILIWLIPQAVLRGMAWSARGEPALLILTPLLWTGIALGVSFFAALMMRFSRWYVIAPSILGLLALPFLGATTYWAFFCQKTALGFFLLGLLALPVTASAALAILKRER
jgi:hypothetical protein